MAKVEEAGFAKADKYLSEALTITQLGPFLGHRKLSLIYVTILSLVKIVSAGNRGNKCFHKMPRFKEKLLEKRDVIFFPSTKYKCAQVSLLGFQIRKQMPLLSNNKIEIRLFF